MAPSKSRHIQDDSRSEASSTKEKLAVAPGPVNGKGRRAATGAGALSSLRDVTSAVATASTIAVASNVSSQETGPGMQWSTVDSEVLHSYRHAYGLTAPTAFKNEQNQALLTLPGIAKLSPTMARRKESRRQSKDSLAHAIRKHFNGLGIVENEVVVDFLYKVKYQDKNFRMRFTPPRPR